MSVSKAFAFMCFLFLLACVFCGFVECSSYETLHSKTKKMKKHHRMNIKNHPPKTSPTPSPSTGHVQGSNIFNVLSFGAKADGITDDSQAFLAAWQAACKVECATIQVPQESKFLVYPIILMGPCQPNLVFQVEGTIVAPASASPWEDKPLQWFNFKQLDSFTISGKGRIDGQGAAWWSDNNKMPSTLPTALRFYGSSGVKVRDISIVNSPQCHLKFDDCNCVKVTGITISSPGDSPNTDGIHLQNSRDVEIQQSIIGCGDDCVSIQTGCSGIEIHNIHCGPSHGISIGGLGPGHTRACVSNISVHDLDIHSSSNGVRIKTWPGGLGSARDVKFQNIRVSNVEMPIVIDQFYCGGSSSESCSTGSSAVAISGIDFEQIRGTYTEMPLHIACSDVVPCKGLSFVDIELHPASYSRTSPLCMNTFPRFTTRTVPPLHCYMRGAHGSVTYADQDTIVTQC